MAEQGEQPVNGVQRGRELFEARRDKGAGSAETPAMRRGRKLYEALHPKKSVS